MLGAECQDRRSLEEGQVQDPGHDQPAQVSQPGEAAELLPRVLAAVT